VIDLHCHLHAGVDDGPPDGAGSVALARALVAAGVTTVACTSHVRPDKGWMNTKERDAERHAKLAVLLADHGVELEHVAGAEHYMHDGVFGDLDRFADMAVPYGNSRFILVETPYLGQPPQLMELLQALQLRGWKLVLAHVERFPYLSDDIEDAQRLVDAGHILQVNLGSLAGSYSRAQQQNAARLLQAGLVGVLAGDCHREDDVAPNIGDGLRAAQKLVGLDVVERLTVTAPRLILDDAPAHKVWP
jgi:protein-tyrosine phosphatase